MQVLETLPLPRLKYLRKPARLMQKRSKQVLKDGRLRTRLRRSISSIVRGPDNNIKSAVRGSPSGREMEANSDRETGEINSTPITVTTDTMPSEELGKNIVGRILLNMMEGCPEGAKKRHAEDSVTYIEATERLQETLEKMWASKTTASRRNLWRRFRAWAREKEKPANASSAVLFVMATGVAVQGLLSYAKSLSAVMGGIGIENGPLLSLAAALRANGAAIPLEQATPMTSFDLVDWARGQELKTHLAMLVCWKTASRWGETAALSRDQFISVSPSEIIIDWFRTPKGRRANPYSPSRWTVIKGNHTEEIKILLDAMGEFKKLHPWDTSKLVKTFQQDGRMKRYTAHSIKRGAISHLLEVLASDQEQQGLTEGLISRLAKHAGVSALSDTTLRYGGNPIAMARALKTGDVTCFL